MLEGHEIGVPGPGQDARLGSLGLVVMVLTVRCYGSRGLGHGTRAGRGSGDRRVPRGASGIMIGRRKLTANQNNQDQDEVDKPTHIALLRDAMKIGFHSGERNVSEWLNRPKYIK